VSVPEAYWLSPNDECARYAHHDNTVANPGYLRFLGEVAEVVCETTAPGTRVLDFGSGENAVLTALLRERGRDCVAYDPLYGIGPDALAARYDAIVVCEVIEHLRELRAELAKLAGCLRMGGHIVIRTRCYPSLTEIPSWGYARDPTHLNFFAERTLSIAAHQLGLGCRTTGAPNIFLWWKEHAKQACC
jgi:hypothetical protein